MEYKSIAEVAAEWGITPRRVQEMCKNGKIAGAARFGKAWQIPAETAKPSDGRTKTGKNSQNAFDGFLIPIPRKNPFLIHTDLYNTPGMADEFINSFSDYPETQKIIKAQIDCRRGNIDEVYKNSNHFLENHGGFYSTISAAVALSFCAIWRGDIALWQKARRHIYSAPYKNEKELNQIEFWLAVMESNIYDVRNYPDWFLEGNFEILPSDTYSTARVFYAKRLFVSAADLASGKLVLENVEKLGLMRTMPYVLAPMISQAKMEKTVVPEIYLRLMMAAALHILGYDEKATHHIDRAIDLCLADRLLGILVEHRSQLGNILDDRLTLKDYEAAEKVKKMHKTMHAGWVKLHNTLLERNISLHLTMREREVAMLAAMGLSNAEIAGRLNIEVSSVKQYVFSAMNKVGAEKRNELGLFI